MEDKLIENIHRSGYTVCDATLLGAAGFDFSPRIDLMCDKYSDQIFDDFVHQMLDIEKANSDKELMDDLSKSIVSSNYIKNKSLKNVGSLPQL